MQLSIVRGALLVVGFLTSAQEAAAEQVSQICSQILPSAEPGAKDRRALLPEDLIQLRDIGPADLSLLDMKLVAISPDGTKIAFPLHRADPASNGFCVAMAIMDLRQGAAPVIVDRGDQLLRVVMEFRPSPAFPTGIPLVITPQWSRDGASIFFLKRTGDFTQVWRADALGRISAPVTNVGFDVEEFSLDGPGEMLIIAGRPGIQREHAAFDKEALRGFHYDDRFAPVASRRPFPARPIVVEQFAVSLATGMMRPASRDEVAILSKRQASPGSPLAPAISRKGWAASLRPEPDSGPFPKLQLTATIDSGRPLICVAEECSGRLFRPSWDGDVIRYFRRENPVASVTSLYEWKPGTSRPRRLFSTNDLLLDCQPANNRLLCLREGSSQPRRIEWLNPKTGQSRPLFDPNPDFTALSLGKVERMTWKNEFGLDTIGDLVYPIGYRPGIRYPLIIVQYDTRGFLRGGIGDEFPIQAFANRGYAVLSFSRPEPIAVVRGAKDIAAVNRGNLTDFADRRSVLSSLKVAIDKLAERGIIDRSLVGITGLSDGGSTIEFGLVNSSLFAAAASSSCCWDASVPARAGPAGARHFSETGYPRISEYRPDFWNRISLVNNASHVRAPLLLQMADDEFMSALPGYTALREHSVPVDLYIFEGEHHVKWQPAHKLAVYRRSLDWFDYWLLGRRSDAPDRKPELDHWDKLRAEAVSHVSDAKPAPPSQ